jgi:competence protein ComEC
MGGELRFREQERSRIKTGEEILFCGTLEKKEYKNGQYVLYLKNGTALVESEEIPCNRVISYLDADDFSVGETLLIKGKVNMFATASNEGQFDLRSFYESQKIDFYLADAAVLQSTGGKDSLGECLYRLKEKLAGVYEASLDYAKEGILSVMLLGEKAGLDSSIRELYQSTGISHILAISGLHVSMIGMGLYRILRKLGKGYLGSFLISVPVIFMYAAMTGNSVSTLRAVGMLVLAMLAGVLGRTYDPLNALGGMVLLLLWQNPFWLWYPGFQLSVCAIFGVSLVGKYLQVAEDERSVEAKTLRSKRVSMKEEYTETQYGGKGDENAAGEKCAGDKPARAKNMRYAGSTRGTHLWNKLYIAVAVWMTSLPLVAYYYYEVPTYGVLLNMLILPLLPALFFFGLFGGLVGCIWLSAAKILLYPCGVILSIYDFLATACLKFPFSRIIVGKPSIFRIVLVYLVLASAVIIWAARRRTHICRWLGIAAVLLVFFWPQQRTFEVDVLDVGQGDGIYLCSENGVSMFIDGGSSNVGSVGTYRILPFLKSKGISHITYWFVTHADSDHISGLKELIESGYQIDYLVVAKAAISTDSDATEGSDMDALVDFAVSYQIKILTIQENDTFVFDGDTLTCLYPAADTQREDKNDLSLVLLYENDNFSGIFTGDISSEVEQQLLNFAELDEIFFYKAAHHGSRYSNSADFLNALAPRVAVVSCSSTNNYGHPSPEAVSHMEEAGAEVYYTMESGQVKITIEGGEVAVSGYASEKVSK